MKYTLLILLLGMPLKVLGETNLHCAIHNTCEEPAIAEIASQLGWDEVLASYDGFELQTMPLRSQEFSDAHVSLISNGALSALLFLASKNNAIVLISAVDVGRAHSFELCDLNHDNNDDICFSAYPVATEVSSFEAGYIQENGRFIFHQ